MATEITGENSEIVNEQNSEASLENIQPPTTLQIESSVQGEEIVLLKRQKRVFKAKLTRLKHQIEKLCITDTVEVTEVESKAEQNWQNLKETHEVIDEITRYYITAGQLEKQLESSEESDDIEAEISKAIENAQSYLKAKYKAKSSQSNTNYESSLLNVNNSPDNNMPPQVNISAEVNTSSSNNSKTTK